MNQFNPCPAHVRPLFLLSALTRALSHRLRNPLSVISNELNYIGTTLPETELRRALENCKTLSEVLTQANLMIPGMQEKLSLSCKDWLARFDLKSEQVQGSDCASQRFELIPDIERAIHLALGLLALKNPRVSVTSKTGVACLELTEDSHEETSEERKFDSATMYASVYTPARILEAVWIDAVLWSQGVDFVLMVSPRISLSLNIPIAA